MLLSQQLIDTALAILIIAPLFSLLYLGCGLLISFHCLPNWVSIGCKALFGFIFFLFWAYIAMFNSPHVAGACFTGGLC